MLRIRQQYKYIVSDNNIQIITLKTVMRVPANPQTRPDTIETAISHS